MVHLLSPNPGKPEPNKISYELHESARIEAN
jgi:hypothetical protein